jgi:hypothetical protein
MLLSPRRVLVAVLLSGTWLTSLKDVGFGFVDCMAVEWPSRSVAR